MSILVLKLYFARGEKKRRRKKKKTADGSFLIDTIDDTTIFF
jgi:hypothetical protein